MTWLMVIIHFYYLFYLFWVEIEGESVLREKIDSHYVWQQIGYYEIIELWPKERKEGVKVLVVEVRELDQFWTKKELGAQLEREIQVNGVVLVCFSLIMCFVIYWSMSAWLLHFVLFFKVFGFLTRNRLEVMKAC